MGEMREIWVRTGIETRAGDIKAGGGCGMESAPDLGFVMRLMTERLSREELEKCKNDVTMMADCLSTAQLAEVLLGALPRRELRWFQPPTPAGRPGQRQRPRQPEMMRAEILDEAYSDLFVADTDALEYLEEIRSVVLAENPKRDADTLQFLLEEYDAYFAKGPPAVPDFFRPVLVVFKKWHERGGGGRDVEMGTGPETAHARTALDPNVTALLARLQALARI